jgi:hypothetical protein
VIVFVASYFSSADVSNELCTASEYERETLVTKTSPIRRLSVVDQGLKK